MRRTRTWLLCAAAFWPALAVPAGEGLRVVTDAGAAHVAWFTRYVEDGPLPVSGRAAIYGDDGLVFSSEDTLYSRYEAFAPAFKDFFLKFHLNVNRWPDPPLPGDSILARDLLLVNFSEPLQPEKPKYFVRYHLFSLNRAFFLLVHFRPSADPASARSIAVPVKKGQPFCVETRFTLSAGDTLRAAVDLDGVPQCTLAGYFGYSWNFIGLATGRWSRRLRPGTEVFLDEISVSASRLPPVPPAPGGLCAELNRWTLALTCGPFRTFYRGERHKSTRWVLLESAFPGVPVFDAVETDPLFFFRRTIPFPLDSGRYSWRCAFANQFGEWSGFSRGETLAVPAGRPLTVTVPEAFFTEPGKERPVEALLAGRWYDLVVFLRTALPWDSLGYVLARLNHPGYTFGHTANFGGVFLSARNYVYNFSFEDPGRGTYRIYEKSKENATLGKCLEKGRTGLYIDADSGKVVLDTLQGLLRFPARVLPGAEPGAWTLSVTARDIGERLSNLFRTRVIVTGPSSRPARALPAGVALAGLVLAALVIILKARALRKTPASVETQIFRQVTEYIGIHLGEELGVKRIKDDLGISQRKFQQALSAQGYANLPSLVNRIRIDRARELLKAPNRTIAEIGFLVGFQEPVYFTKVFRELTGTTPSEFREKNPG